jgi:hypothetical protein
LLVSQAFLASKYIRSSELPVLLNQARRNGALIIPIIVRRSLFAETKFKYLDPVNGPEELSLASFQSANPPDKPLIALSEDEQDQVFLSVAQRLLEISRNPAPAPAAMPVLTGLSPQTVTAGGPGFALTVSGSNFANDSGVLWNGHLVDEEDAVILGFIRWRRTLRRALATCDWRPFGCRRRVARRWRRLSVRSRGADGASRCRSGRRREAGGLFVFLLRFKRQLLGFGEVSVGKRCAGGETRLLGFPP